MFDIDDVNRYVAGYSKIPDKYGYFPLEITYEFAKPISLAFLQKLFNVDPNDPDKGERYLIDPYKIDEKQAKAMQPFIKEKLDLKKYRFQLECCSKELPEFIFTSENAEDDLKRFVACVSKKIDSNGRCFPEKRYEFQKPILLNFLRKLFKVENPESLLTFQEINQEQAQALQPYIKEKFDLKNNNYVLRAIHKGAYEAWKKKN